MTESLEIHVKDGKYKIIKKHQGKVYDTAEGDVKYVNGMIALNDVTLNTALNGAQEDDEYENHHFNTFLVNTNKGPAIFDLPYHLAPYLSDSCKVNEAKTETQLSR